MDFRRRRELGIATLVLAGCLAAASARAVPITVYDHVDLGAERIAASERIGSISEGAAATVDVALDVAPTQTDLSIAALEVSFHRWDYDEIGRVSGSIAAPVDPRF